MLNALGGDPFVVIEQTPYGQYRFYHNGFDVTGYVRDASVTFFGDDRMPELHLDTTVNLPDAFVLKSWRPRWADN